MSLGGANLGVNLERRLLVGFADDVRQRYELPRNFSLHKDADIDILKSDYFPAPLTPRVNLGVFCADFADDAKKPGKKGKSPPGRETKSLYGRSGIGDVEFQKPGYMMLSSCSLQGFNYLNTIFPEPRDNVGPQDIRLSYGFSFTKNF